METMRYQPFHIEGLYQKIDRAKIAHTPSPNGARVLNLTHMAARVERQLESVRAVMIHCKTLKSLGETFDTFYPFLSRFDETELYPSFEKYETDEYRHYLCFHDTRKGFPRAVHLETSLHVLQTVWLLLTRDS
jgi:hypothetical protein